MDTAKQSVSKLPSQGFLYQITQSVMTLLESSRTKVIRTNSNVDDQIFDDPLDPAVRTNDRSVSIDEIRLNLERQN